MPQSKSATWSRFFGASIKAEDLQPPVPTRDAAFSSIVKLHRAPANRHEMCREARQAAEQNTEKALVTQADASDKQPSSSKTKRKSLFFGSKRQSRPVNASLQRSGSIQKRNSTSAREKIAPPADTADVVVNPIAASVAHGQPKQEKARLPRGSLTTAKLLALDEALMEIARQRGSYGEDLSEEGHLAVASMPVLSRRANPQRSDDGCQSVPFDADNSSYRQADSSSSSGEMSDHASASAHAELDDPAKALTADILTVVGNLDVQVDSNQEVGWITHDDGGRGTRSVSESREKTEPGSIRYAPHTAHGIVSFSDAKYKSRNSRASKSHTAAAPSSPKLRSGNRHSAAPFDESIGTFKSKSSSRASKRMSRFGALALNSLGGYAPPPELRAN